MNANAAGQYLLQRFDEGPVTVVATDPRTGLRGFASAVLVAGASVTVDVGLTASGTVEGTVFGRGDVPVGPGVAVVLRGPVNRETVTDRFSRFRFDFIALGAYTVEAFDGVGNRGRTGAAITGTNQVVAADVTFLGKGRVRGLVETGGGALVAGAQVALSGSGVFGGSGSAVSDGVGAFVIEDVFVGPFAVTARDPRTGLAAAGEGRVSFEGEDVRVSLTLRAAGQIGGMVRASDEETPVPGAIVTVDPGGRRVVADGAGRFVVEGLPLGRYAVTAQPVGEADRGRVEVDVLEADREVVADVTLRGLGTVEVRVRDAGGAAVANTRVALSGRAGFVQELVGVSGADGVARFEGVIAGGFGVAATEPLSGLSGEVASSVLAGETVGVELRLEGAATVSGRALAADGATPVRGVRVRLVPSEREVWSDAAGRFRFDLVPVAGGPYGLEAFDGTGTRRARVVGVAPVAHGEVVERDLVLIGTGTVVGVARDPEGRPVVGAAVTVDSAVEGAPRRFAATGPDGVFRVVGVPVGRVTVAASLRAGRLAGQRLGEVRADGEVVELDVPMAVDVIPPPGDPAASLGNPRVARLFDGNNLEFAIHQDGSIRNGTGNVFRGDGGLSSGGFLLGVRGEGEAGFAPFVGRGGRLELGGRQVVLPGDGPGGLRITRKVFVPADGYFVRFLEVLENPTDAPVTVDLQVQSHFSFTTEVRDGFTFTDPPQLVTTGSGDGFVLVGAALGAGADRWAMVDDDDDVDPFEAANSPPVVHVFDGDAGGRGADEAAFELDPGARFARLSATWRRVAVQPRSTVVVMHVGVQQLDREGALVAAERLAAGAPELLAGLSVGEVGALLNFGAGAVAALPALDAAVEGRVLEGDGVTLVPGAGVRWQSRHPLFRRVQRVMARADGRYGVVARVGSDRGDNVVVPRVGFDVWGVHPSTELVAPRVGGAFGGVGAAVRDVVFGNGAVVGGVVRRADGNVVSSGEVALLDSGLRRAPRVPIAVDGRFVLTGVPAGSFRVQAEVPIPGGTPLLGGAPVVVRAGEALEVPITLAAAGGVGGTVRDGGGNPAVGVAVGVAAGALRRRGETDTGGRYAFFDLPEGVVRVSATETRTGIVSAVDVLIDAAEQATADLALVPLGSVRLVVTDSRGAALVDAPVAVRRAAMGEHFVSAGRTGPGGVLRVFDVPRGAFTVRAQNPRNSEIVAAGDGAVANHGEEVELRLVVPVDEPPQVVVTAPVAGAAVLEGTVVTIRAEAVDDFGVRRVEFYADGVAIGADETAPYAVDYVMPQGDGGAVAVTAVAVDGGQNRTTSAVVSVVRRDDAQLPTVRFTAPFEGAAFIEGTTVDVAVNAADDVAVARVEFLADGAPIGVVAEPPYAVRYAVPVGRPGALTLAAVVVDGAGNRVEAQRVITVVDDAPPVLRVVEVPARVVEGQPVRVVAEVVDEGEVTVDLLAPGGGGAGAVRVVETRTRPPYRFEQTAPPAASVGGIWNLTVRARDTQDQVSQQEIPIEVVVDAPPVVRILAPGVGAVGTEGATVAVTAEAEDELGVAEVRFFVDGVQRAARLAPPFTADLQIPAGDDGAPVAFRVEAVDTGGQVGQAQVEVTRRDDAVPPTGRITSPEAGSTLTVGPSDVMILLARDTRAGPIADIGFGGDGRAAQVAVARALVARFDPATTRIGVADYADAALTRQAITGDFALVDAAFAAFVARGAAGAPDLGDAIDETLRRLVRAPARRAAAPVVYLFSLGGGAVPGAALERAVAAGLVVHTVGFGAVADPVLGQIAAVTGGVYTRLAGPAELTALDRVAQIGAAALVVTVDASDDVAVRRVTASATGNGIVTAVVDDRAPFNMIIDLPPLGGPTALTLGGSVEDFGDVATPLEPVEVTVLPADTAPVIDAVAPAVGAEGDLVVLSGRFFDPAGARNTVRFGGAAGRVIDATKIELVVEVPLGAGDGITVEAEGRRSSPIAFALDNDRDGMTDAEERARGLDPRVADSDGDGIDDGDELAAGTDPGLADTDGDGLRDGFEVAFGFDPTGPDDGGGDPDNDGLINRREQLAATDPRVPDSDGDGLLDGAEIDTHGTDPARADTDGGGVVDGDEVRDDGTDPRLAGDDRAPRATPLVLRDGDGFNWDIADDGHVEQGTFDAFDGALRLRVGGQAFPVGARVTAELGGRQLRIGPAAVAGLQVRRKVYVPADAGFARYAEIIDNPSGAAVAVTVQLTGRLGSDGETRLVASSSADGQTTAADDWWITDDGDAGGGDPPVELTFSGVGARVEPSLARVVGATYTIDLPVVVPASGRVVVLHFARQRPNRAAALADAGALASLSGGALAGLRVDERAGVVNFNAAPDADGDGLSDVDELTSGTDPAAPDTDDDGLLDGFEVRFGFDPLTAGEGGGDPDNDGLTTLREQAAGTNPRRFDSDGDGLGDGAELDLHGTDPLSIDTDLDGLTDGVEIDEAGSDPTAADTDGDGLDDADEFELIGTDPARPDTDGDGMPDGYEFAEGFDPLLAADGVADADLDGLVNRAEFAAGTDPRDADSDDDGLHDGEEVAIGTDPLEVDTDGGGRSDFDETRRDGTNPLDPLDDRLVAPLPVTLVDGAGYRWDVVAGGAIADGTDNAFDNAFRLGGDVFFDYAGEALLVAAGRELVLGPLQINAPGGPLRITRRIFVPADEAFVRYVDVFENPGAVPRALDVDLAVDLGSDATTRLVVETTDDGSIDPRDDAWVIASESDHAVAMVVADERAPLRPLAASLGGDDVSVTWRLLVPAQGRVALLHYAAQRSDIESAASAADRLLRLQGAALADLDPALRAVVVNRSLVPDTDGDDLRDDEEALAGTDPADPDSDADGLRDGFEVRFGFDPLSPGEGGGDPDNDELTTLDEQAIGSDPTLADTDGDGLTDGAEATLHGTLPTRADTDRGGVDDGAEIAAGTDPLDPADDRGNPGLCEFTANAFLVTPPGGRYAFDTTGAPSSGASTFCGGGGGQAVAVVDVVERAEVSMIIIDAEHDTVIALQEVCGDDASEVDCNDDFNDVLSGLELILEPGRYYLILDGFEGDEGQGTLEVTYTARP
ncbi:MAG: carboxypeptidase regulatory-like domain-containing protein [Myxococcales bacterium]|nr:carboxypeptidase regulatory-like domain-containing protein [Myxococcales bacterium]